MNKCVSPHVAPPLSPRCRMRTPKNPYVKLYTKFFNN